MQSSPLIKEASSLQQMETTAEDKNPSKCIVMESIPK